MHRRSDRRNKSKQNKGMREMGKTPLETIGGGGRLRRCTANASDILDDLALEIWAVHKWKSREIGMMKPAASMAIDCLIYHAVKNGDIKVKEPLTPENNMYLAIID